MGGGCDDEEVEVDEEGVEVGFLDLFFGGGMTFLVIRNGISAMRWGNNWTKYTQTQTADDGDETGMASPWCFFFFPSYTLRSSFLARDCELF